jgi:hypothetical protein
MIRPIHLSFISIVNIFLRTLGSKAIFGAGAYGSKAHPPTLPRNTPGALILMANYQRRPRARHDFAESHDQRLGAIG